MNDKQLDLIKQIISEQLEDYLAAKLAEDLTNSIMMGIFDNMEIFEKLAEGGITHGSEEQSETGRAGAEETS